MKNAKTLTLVQLAVLTALELIFCFVTPLGSLRLGPGIAATLSHLPAIMAALLLGARAGAAMGTVFGFSSLAVWTFMPPNPAVAFAFTPFASNGNPLSLVICILPRIIFPILTAWLFYALKDKIKLVPAAAVSAILGTMVHSVLVLSLIYFVFKNSKFVGQNYINFIISLAGINALLEMLVAGILATALIVPLKKIAAAK